MPGITGLLQPGRLRTVREIEGGGLEQPERIAANYGRERQPGNRTGLEVGRLINRKQLELVRQRQGFIDAKAAANSGLPVPEGIPGKADAQ